jgi:enoyl-CoA hydratase/carnithine racemase
MDLEAEMDTVASYAGGKLLAGRMGAIGLLVLNQPEKRNAMSQEMWDGLCDALDLFETDAGVRVVIYAGAGGKAFCAGNDISQFASRRSNAAANEEFSRITDRGREKLKAFPKPSIACIRGYCMGGGLAIALQADLRVAGGDAVLGVPAARMGIAYGIEPMERLVALVGPASARLMLYTARRFTGVEAFAMGLVDVLAADDAGLDALELARSVADNAPLSVMAAKFTIDQVMKAPEHRDLDSIRTYGRRCMDSADYREGRTAFMEKRRPAFVGV